MCPTILLSQTHTDSYTITRAFRPLLEGESRLLFLLSTSLQKALHWHQIAVSQLLHPLHLLSRFLYIPSHVQ